MRRETKEVVYIVLDFLESFSKASKENSSFINVNKKILDEVRDELFKLINQIDKTDNFVDDSKKELIGILPSVLIDKSKFPTNESIVKLAEQSLGLKINNWRKKKRDEIIGILISKIVERDFSELDMFIKAWKEFTGQENIKDKPANEDFVDLWLKFFEHYTKGSL